MALFKGKDRTSLPLLTQFYALAIPSGWEERPECLIEEESELRQFLTLRAEYDHAPGASCSSRSFDQRPDDLAYWCVLETARHLAKVHSPVAFFMDALAHRLPVSVADLMELRSLLYAVASQRARLIEDAALLGVEIETPPLPSCDPAVWAVQRASRAGCDSVFGIQANRPALPEDNRQWSQEDWNGEPYPNQGILLEVLPPETMVPLPLVRIPKTPGGRCLLQVAEDMTRALQGEIALAVCAVCENAFVRQHRDADKCSSRCRKKACDASRPPRRYGLSGINLRGKTRRKKEAPD